MGEIKVIAAVTLIGESRRPMPPGTEISLPEDEARSLLERGLATLPPLDQVEAGGKTDNGNQPGAGGNTSDGGGKTDDRKGAEGSNPGEDGNSGNGPPPPAEPSKAGPGTENPPAPLKTGKAAQGKS